MGFFSKKTVDDIVAPITRIVEALHTHADEHTALANNYHESQKRHQEMAIRSWEESDKARQTAGKIAGLVGQ